MHIIVLYKNCFNFIEIESLEFVYSYIEKTWQVLICLSRHICQAQTLKLLSVMIKNYGIIFSQ